MNRMRDHRNTQIPTDDPYRAGGTSKTTEEQDALVEVDDCEECPDGIMRCAHSKTERLVLSTRPASHSLDCIWTLLREVRKTPPYSVLHITYRGKGPCKQCGQAEVFKNIGEDEILFVESTGNYHQASAMFDRRLRMATRPIPSEEGAQDA